MKQWKVIIFSIICAFSQEALFAEIITLKSGKQVEGRITEENEQYIKIDIEGHPVYFERKYIKTIEGRDATIKQPSGKELPVEAEFYLKEGLRAGADNMLEEAARIFNQGLEKTPDNHNLKEALKIIEGFKKNEISREYALRLLRGSKFLMDSQFTEAFAEFKEALKDKPQDPDLNYYLGICKYAAGDFEEAVSFFKNAASQNPDQEIYYYLGASLYSLGRFREALDYLNKAVEMNPNDADAHGIMGVCYSLMDNRDKAIEHMERSNELFRQKGDYLKSSEINELLSQIKKSDNP